MLLTIPKTENLEEVMQKHLARIDLFSESVRATLYNHEGASSFEVDPESLAAVFGKAEFGTGLLPPMTVFYERYGRSVRMGLYLPELVRTLTVHAGSEKTETLRVPCPHMILVGENRTYGLFALAGPPTSMDQPIYRAPFSNVSESNGKICFGSITPQSVSAENIQGTGDLFFKSLFNGDLSNGKCVSYPDSVIDLWKSINGKRKFPYKELIPSSQFCIRNLMRWNQHQPNHVQGDRS